jgi:hypothetical protein
MKKTTSILIAMFAVMAAASTAKAGDIVDFDGRTGPKALTREITFEGQSGLEIPMPSNPDMLKSISGESFGEFARYYLAQAKIKKTVAEYYRLNNNEGAAAALMSKDVRIAATGGVVYIVHPGEVAKLEAPELARAITKIVQPRGQQKSAATVANVIAAGAASSAVAANVITGGVAIITCMTYDPCWNAVGDGVSAISQWWNS